LAKWSPAGQEGACQALNFTIDLRDRAILNDVGASAERIETKFMLKGLNDTELGLINGLLPGE
jgi:hypothetical protein